MNWRVFFAVLAGLPLCGLGIWYARLLVDAACNLWGVQVVFLAYMVGWLLLLATAAGLVAA